MFPNGEQDDFSQDMALLNSDEGTAPVAGAPPVEGALETPPPEEGVVEPPVEGDEEPVEDEKKEEGEEEEEVEEELPTPIHVRPTVTDIRTKYPNFFKDFPDMKHVLFREQEYAGVFPTVDDAKEAATKAEDFDNFSNLVTSGKREDFDGFLKGVKDTGSLESMAAHFLPALHKADQNLYFQVTGPLVESLIRRAHKAGADSGNENLKNAAEHIASWAFGDHRFATGEKFTPELKPAEPKVDTKLEADKKNFYQARYDEAQSFVKNTSSTRLATEIRKGLDPNNVFKPYTQGLLVKQILEEIGEVLQADQGHIKGMNSLWKKGHEAGFTGNWKDRLLSTYLSRARQIMPAIRTKVRNLALDQERSSAEQTRRTAERSADRKEVPGSQSAARGGSPAAAARVDASKIDWSQTSDVDFLNDRVTYKK